MSFLGRIRESLSRTTRQIVERFDELARKVDAPEQRSRAIDVETLDALEELLITADVGVAASERIVEAVHILDTRRVDFEYDGEIAVDVALDREKMLTYPFCRLTDTANVLVMPAIHSAAISTRLLSQLGGVTMMGPLLVGLEKSVQIAPLGAKMSEIYNSAVIAAL